MSNKVKELQVSAIENGTVIDHISSGNVLRVVKILGLEDIQEPIYLGANLSRKKYGSKGIVKVSNRYFQAHEINKIALVSPNASIIEIRDFEVVKKSVVEVPDYINNIVKCFNPNCITNVEDVSTKFAVIDKKDVKLRCNYCEKITAKANINFI